MHTHTSVLPQFLSPPPFLASHSFLQNLAFPKFVSNPNPQFMHSEYVGPRMRTLRPRKTVQVDRRCGASEQEGGSGEKAQQPRKDNVSGFHAASRNRQCLQALVCSACVCRNQSKWGSWEGVALCSQMMPCLRLDFRYHTSNVHQKKLLIDRSSRASASFNI